MRRAAIRRLTALMLSWTVPATSVWSAAPAGAPAASPERGPMAAAPETFEPSTPSIGILVGQVLSDATGLPVPTATVRVAGSSDPARPVDLEGRYALPVMPGAAVL